MIRACIAPLLCVWLCCLAIPFSVESKPLRIGSVMDGEAATTMEQRNALFQRLRAHPDLQDGIELPPDAQLSFTAANPQTLAHVDAFCRNLMERDDLDIILSFDLHSARSLLQHNNGRTPLFILSGDDPVRAGLLPSREDSGAKNVTASLRDNYARQTLTRFHTILQFKRLGLLYVDTPVGRISSRYAEAEEIARTKGFELVLETVSEEEAFTNCDAAVSRLAARKPDAFFLGALLCLDPDSVDLTASLAPMTTAGIPSLVQDSPEQVHAGALIGLTKDIDQLAKINSKKIVAALAGQSPRSMPMKVPFYPRLSLNTAVASQLAFQPTYGLLADVDIFFYDIRNYKKSHAR